MRIKSRTFVKPVENWRTFPEIAPYEVSDQGRVRSPSRRVPYRNTGESMLLKERILKTNAMPKGHLQVTLQLSTGKKTFFVHRLVLTAFVGPSELGTRHLNDIPSDNRLSNLAWGTQQDNMNDREYHKGPDNPLSRFTKTDEVAILTLASIGHSVRSIARIYNVSHSTIRRVITQNAHS